MVPAVPSDWPSEAARFALAQTATPVVAGVAEVGGTEETVGVEAGEVVGPEAGGADVAGAPDAGAPPDEVEGAEEAELPQAAVRPARATLAVSNRTLCIGYSIR